MRVYGPTGSRNIPQDRNPATVAVVPANQTVGGATTGVIVTYTVPANRRAFVGQFAASMSVQTVLAAGQHAFLELVVTPNGGAATLGPLVKTEAAAALARHFTLAGGNVWLKAGDAVDLRCANEAGAGVMDAHGGLTAVEFDT